MIPPAQEWTDLGCVFLSGAGRLELRAFKSGQWSVRTGGTILASGSVLEPVAGYDLGQCARRAAENAALEIGRAIVRDLGEWPE